jgi:hypothetical protein
MKSGIVAGTFGREREDKKRETRNSKTKDESIVEKSVKESGEEAFETVESEGIETGWRE